MPVRVENRLSPSGPQLQNGVQFPPGFVIRSQLLSAVITSGTFQTAAELQSDMSAPSNPHTLRPALIGPRNDRNYRVKSSVVFNSTVDITAAVQLSLDGFTTVAASKTTSVQVNSGGRTQMDLSYEFLGSDLPAIPDGATLSARTVLSTAAFSAIAVSPAPDGSAAVELEEVTAPPV